MEVIIWTTAAQFLLGVSPERLRAMWEEGDANEDRRPNLLKTLNTRLQENVLIGCTAKIWKGTHAQHIEVNVNSATEGE